MPRQPKEPRSQSADAPYARPTPNRRQTDPLDGSTTGTIGGGGPESGGRGRRAAPPDTPPAKPENAASGRLEPDPLAATIDRDDLRPGPSDVSQAGSRPTSHGSPDDRAHRH